MQINTDRRTFLKGAAASAGALVLGFPIPGAVAGGSKGQTLNAWLEVTAEGKVRIAQPQGEMGQGVWTSMAQLIADELEVNWDDVEIYSPLAAPAFAHPFYGFQCVAESFTMRAFWEPARMVGAQAREMLKLAAAEMWGVYPGSLQARGGAVVDPVSGRSAPYAALAVQAAKYQPPEGVRLKEPHEWTIIGKSLPRADTPAKVNGSAKFGIDMAFEGLLTAVPVFAPSFTGKVASVDDTASRAVNGVVAVTALDDVVYVVANGMWPALKGAKVLKVEWDLGEAANLSTDTIFGELRNAASEGAGAVVEEDGDVAGAFGAAMKTLDITLEAPYLAHITMEPMNATAHVTADKLTVWAPTQAQGLMGFVAQAVGLPAQNVECHTTFMGCGLGRRFEIDLPIHAALVSKAVGAPVKVVWTREDDTRRDFYRPGAVARMRAAIDADGKVAATEINVAGSSILARAVPDLAKDGVDHTNIDGLVKGTTPAGVGVLRQYEAPASRATYAMANYALPVGFWRSVAHSQNGWFMEGFLNEIAAEAGRDPVELRLEMMTSERNRTTLERLATEANWGSPAPGHAQGIAIHEAFGTVLGHVIEIGVEDKAITLAKVTSVAEVGHAVNPSTLEAQVTSGAITGLSSTMWGEITVANGAVEQGNFDTLRILKLAETPVFSVTILTLGGPIGGIGEPGMPPVAPALVHALFNATGERTRALPLAKAGYTLA
ncbi:MAG: molybdopterin cofactor-binding domain-containing protein [Pseudomonadota bacterium]